MPEPRRSGRSSGRVRVGVRVAYKFPDGWRTGSVRAEASPTECTVDFSDGKSRAMNSSELHLYQTQAELNAVIARLATVATDYPDSPRAIEFARRYVNPAPAQQTPSMPTPQIFPQRMDADSGYAPEPGNDGEAGDAALPNGDPSAIP